MHCSNGSRQIKSLEKCKATFHAIFKRTKRHTIVHAYMQFEKKWLTLVIFIKHISHSVIVHLYCYTRRFGPRVNGWFRSCVYNKTKAKNNRWQPSWQPSGQQYPPLLSFLNSKKSPFQKAAAAAVVVVAFYQPPQTRHNKGQRPNPLQQQSSQHSTYHRRRQHQSTRRHARHFLLLLLLLLGRMSLETTLVRGWEMPSVGQWDSACLTIRATKQEDKEASQKGNLG